MTSDKIVKGINILAKYPKAYFAAEHDQIWFGPEDEKAVSEEDAKALEELGWFKEEDFGWSRYV